MRSPELQSINLASCFAGRKIPELIVCIALDTHVTRHGVQTRAVTTRAFVCLPFVFFFQAADGIRVRSPAFLLNRSSDLLIKMMLVMVSVAAISKTFGLL